MSYYYYYDILVKENVEFVHYPTYRMIVDFCTKPLQGSLFRTMRDKVMGLTPFPEG